MNPEFSDKHARTDVRPNVKTHNALKIERGEQGETVVRWFNSPVIKGTIDMHDKIDEALRGEDVSEEEAAA